MYGTPTDGDGRHVRYEVARDGSVVASIAMLDGRTYRIVGAPLRAGLPVALARRDRYVEKAVALTITWEREGRGI